MLGPPERDLAVRAPQSPFISKARPGHLDPKPGLDTDTWCPRIFGGRIRILQWRSGLTRA
eukprot:7727980-Pyramimonas_sp.AAC.1